MSKIHFKHSVQISLEPATRSLLEGLLPPGKPGGAPRPMIEADHVLPLLTDLYRRAHAADQVSEPTKETTIDRDAYISFNRLKTMLASVGIHLYFPQELNRPGVKVHDTIEDESVCEPAIASIMCPGLFCTRTETHLKPAVVLARIPVRQAVSA